MSWKGVLGKIGDIGKKVAPLATFIPGVGPVVAGLAGAGFAGLGKLNDQGATFGNTLGSMAGYGLGGYAGAKAIDRFAPTSWTGATRGAPSVGGGVGGAAVSQAANGLKGAGGGGGMDLKDWLALGTAGVGAAGAAFGGYKQGQSEDALNAENKRQFDVGQAWKEKTYGDTRADLAAELERKRRSGVALNPLVAGLWQGRQGL